MTQALSFSFERSLLGEQLGVLVLQDRKLRRNFFQGKIPLHNLVLAAFLLSPDLVHTDTRFSGLLRRRGVAMNSQNPLADRLCRLRNLLYSGGFEVWKRDISVQLFESRLRHAVQVEVFDPVQHGHVLVRDEFPRRLPGFVHVKENTDRLYDNPDQARGGVVAPEFNDIFFSQRKYLSQGGDILLGRHVDRVVHTLHQLIHCSNPFLTLELVVEIFDVQVVSEAFQIRNAQHRVHRVTDNIPELRLDLIDRPSRLVRPRVSFIKPAQRTVEYGGLLAERVEPAPHFGFKRLQAFPYAPLGNVRGREGGVPDPSGTVVNLHEAPGHGRHMPSKLDCAFDQRPVRLQNVEDGLEHVVVIGFVHMQDACRGKEARVEGLNLCELRRGNVQKKFGTDATGETVILEEGDNHTEDISVCSGFIFHKNEGPGVCAGAPLACFAQRLPHAFCRQR